MAYTGPRPHRSGGSSVNEVLSRTLEEIQYAFRASAVTMLAKAAETGLATFASNPELNKMLEDLRADRVPDAMRQAMWANIGEKARNSLISAYANRQYKRPVASYRVGDRFSGGVLGEALASKEIYEATAFGLNFLNRELLDEKAKQWRRLNFGAGAGGQESDLSAPKKFPVTGLGFVIGFQPDVRPAFGMPKGFFLDQNHSTERVGLDAFHPSGPDAVRITRGIAARNFLDPPMEIIASSIRPGLTDMFRQFYATKPKTARITVRSR